MSVDLARLLEDRGIRLKSHAEGEYRTRCPQCARPPHKPDEALAVRVDDKGAAWWCHRCEWHGGVRESRPLGADTCSNGSTICRKFDETSRRVKLSAGEVLQQPVESANLAHAQSCQRPGKRWKLSDWGRDLWSKCRPIEPGTPAAAYLEFRGCAMPPTDGDLRWHPALKHPTGYRGPALVALVTHAETNIPLTLHRTWILPDGAGKAGIEPTRMLLRDHPKAGGVCRLWPDNEIALGLTLGEGIESCLAAARAGYTNVWATIDANNLAAFPVLPGIEGLTVLVDHDPPNPKTGKRTGIEAARTLVKRYVAAGFDPTRDIQVIFPPGEGADAADLEVIQ